MGLQKLAIDRMPQAGGPARKRFLVSLWILGLLCQFAVVLLAAKALTIGNASTLGGFAGFGLVVLALFCHFVLKEEMFKQELAGIALILAGSTLLGIFSHGFQSGHAHFESRGMIIFLSVYLCAVALAVVFMLRNVKAYGGAVLGTVGGSMGGLAMIFMKILVSRFAGTGVPLAVGALLSDVYFWMMVVGGLGGVGLVQVGYKFGKAIQVVPGFASMVVIMPALCGFIVLREPLPLICAISILIITAGILVTTTAAPGKRKTEASPTA
jgi:drug/metabolite transporter (DMT)-like permease